VKASARADQRGRKQVYGEPNAGFRAIRGRPNHFGKAARISAETMTNPIKIKRI
jgi:hypothetical protein